MLKKIFLFTIILYQRLVSPYLAQSCRFQPTCSEYAKEAIEKYKIDIIVSTGPPHTTHLIAMKVKKKYKIPWLADFRDPWTNIDFYQKLNLSFIADRMHRYYELNVLKGFKK